MPVAGTATSAAARRDAARRSRERYRRRKLGLQPVQRDLPAGQLTRFLVDIGWRTRAGEFHEPWYNCVIDSLENRVKAMPVLKNPRHERFARLLTKRHVGKCTTLRSR